MTKNIDSPSDRAMGTNPGTPSNTRIPGNHRMRTYFDVMRNLNQIIYLNPIGNDSVIQRTTVNAGIGTNFYIVANGNSSQLFYLVPATGLFGKAKTIGTNHHPGM